MANKYTQTFILLTYRDIIRNIKYSSNNCKTLKSLTGGVNVIIK